MKSYTPNFKIMLKPAIRLVLLISGLLLFSHQDVWATHIVGGNLTYRCLGNNMYEIRLTVRRDCLLGAPDAQFDDPASVGFFDGVTHQLLTFLGGNTPGELRIPLNNNDTLNEILHSDCSVISGDVCVHTTTYIDTIFLPFRATGYTMAYMRCCRNGSLTNVLNPLNTGMTLVAELSGFAQTECNSSPQFKAFPPIYTCVNKPIEFDHSAIDMEDDSLVYSLCTPNAGGDMMMNRPQPPFNPPYDPVVWRPPYDLSNLMGGSVPLAIDPLTGFLTGTPNTVGQFVIGICVTAYKKGTNQITGVTRRDFQYNVRMCRDVPTPIFSAPPLTCDGRTITFQNQSLLADEYKWIFDFDNYPNSDTSAEFSPTYTYAQDGFYNVALIVTVVENGVIFCPDTIIHQVGVFDSQIQAGFIVDVPQCSLDGVVIAAMDTSTGFGNYQACEWNWLLTVDGNIFPATGANPVFPQVNIHEEASALLCLEVTSCNGCDATDCFSFPVKEITIPFNSDSICRGDTIPLLLAPDCDLTYTWGQCSGINPQNGCDAIAYPGISTDCAVTVTDGFCEVTGTVHIGVQQLPNLDFAYEADCRSLTVVFDNISTNGVLYHWDFGDGNGSDEESPTHTYSQPGNYTVVLSSRDGCEVKLDTVIDANAINADVPDHTVNCFKDSIALYPGANELYTYMWSPGQFLGQDDVPNPMASVVDDTEFYVTISQAGLEGCEIYDTILVIVPDDFLLDAGGDVTYCTFDTVHILATITNGNGNETFTWYDSLGVLIKTGPELDVTPVETTTYTVVATDSLGCTKTDQITVFRPDPSFVPKPCFSDSAYCDIQTITLCVEPIVGVTFEWFNSNGDPIGQGESVEVTPGIPTVFEVIGTDNLGCEANSIVSLTPTFFDLDITPDQLICLSDPAEVCIVDQNGQNLSYVWSPNGDTDDCITVSPLETTQYCVQATNNVLGCIDTVCSVVTVSVFSPENIIITSSEPNDSINLPDDIQLFVNQDPNFGYQWSSSPTSADPIPGVFDPVVTPPASGNVTYTVTVTNDDGCTGTASIVIRVGDPPCDDETIFLPNAFTPNDDGVNDILFIRTSFDQLASIELHIYNRWGEEVFKTNDINTGWNGTYKGEKVHPDVFGYYMNIGCPNQKTFFKKGNITLLW